MNGLSMQSYPKDFLKKQCGILIQQCGFLSHSIDSLLVQGLQFFGGKEANFLAQGCVFLEQACSYYILYRNTFLVYSLCSFYTLRFDL